MKVRNGKNCFESLAVVLAVKNGEKTLNKCLASLKDIVIGGGINFYVFDPLSTDSTKLIVDKFFPNANYYLQVDTGLYDAWNRSLKIVKEQYIFFINCDDYIYSSKNLKKLLDEINENNKLVAVSGKTIMIRPDGKIRTSGLALAKNWYVGDMPVITPATVFSVKSIQSVGGFNLIYKISADYEMVLKLLLTYKKESFKFLNVIVTNFSLNGMSNLNREKAFSEIRCIIRKNLGIDKFYLHCIWYFWNSLKRLILRIKYRN